MKESYKKGESESILAPSLAAGVARRQSKRRQGYRWAGWLSFEKAWLGRWTLFPTRKATRLVALHREWPVGPA